MTKRVMIVEDNKGCSDLYKDQFEFMGYEVRQVWAGEAVAGALNEFWPDVIILDLMLPGMSGQDVLTWLKNNEPTKNIPVMILTAMLYKEQEEDELRAQCQDYLVKIDVTPQEVAERAGRLIANKEQEPHYV